MKKVKTDININGSTIRLSQRASRALNCRTGQVLGVKQFGTEIYLCVDDNPDGIYSGRLYRTHGGFRCSNINLVRALTDLRVCAFRCGECIIINGKSYLTVITGKNYATTEN